MQPTGEALYDPYSAIAFPPIAILIRSAGHTIEIYFYNNGFDVTGADVYVDGQHTGTLDTRDARAQISALCGPDFQLPTLLVEPVPSASMEQIASPSGHVSESGHRDRPFPRRRNHRSRQDAPSPGRRRRHRGIGCLRAHQPGQGAAGRRRRKLGAAIASPSLTRQGFLGYADLNHDGSLDPIFADMPASSTEVMFGLGDETFQAGREYLLSARPASIRIVPLADGNTSVITADNFGQPETDNENRAGRLAGDLRRQEGERGARIDAGWRMEDRKRPYAFEQGAEGSIV